MHTAVAGRILGGQAECVPAHRVQDIEATGALIAGDDVAHRVIARMANMDASRWIGKHLKDIVFGLTVLSLRPARPEGVTLRPSRLPFWLGFTWIVSAHRLGSQRLTAYPVP